MTIRINSKSGSGGVGPPGPPGANGFNGAPGVDGIDGANGLDGAAGIIGANGVSPVLWITYAVDLAGNNFSYTPVSGLNFIAMKGFNPGYTPSQFDFAGLWAQYIFV